MRRRKRKTRKQNLFKTKFFNENFAQIIRGSLNQSGSDSQSSNN